MKIVATGKNLYLDISDCVAKARQVGRQASREEGRQTDRMCEGAGVCG